MEFSFQFDCDTMFSIINWRGRVAQWPRPLRSRMSATADAAASTAQPGNDAPFWASYWASKRR